MNESNTKPAFWGIKTKGHFEIEQVTISLKLSRFSQENMATFAGI